MKLIPFFLLIGWLFIGCDSKKDSDLTIVSPNGEISLVVGLHNGQPTYAISRHGESIILPSKLGFNFQNQPQPANHFIINSTHKNSFSETYTLPYGEQKEYDNSYNELVINLLEDNEPFRRLQLIFRAFDDGVGFRYHFPEKEGMDSLLIVEELTEFNLAQDLESWWIPGDWDSYEHLYNHTRLSQIDATKKRNHPNLGTTFIPENAVNTPITMISSDGVHISIHEAALTDYPDMTLGVDTARLKLQAKLVGHQQNKNKAVIPLPFSTPWRTIIIAEDAKKIMTSNLILNLNEPSKIKNTDWIKPMKYTGIWLQMHIGTMSWDYGTGKHGATTENAKKFIDFAADNGIGGLLIEGWNTGWKDWFTGVAKDSIFDFVTATPDYNLPEVAAYAKSKGVELIMHHETAGAALAYEQHLDSAFALMNALGISYVKTGYVGEILPKGEHHHSQWMVKHYQKVIEKAAQHHIAVIAHEPIKATGVRRTYPNMISREGLRGQEFNVWGKDGGNPPEHLTVIPFTRMLGGPVDYTPGIFNTQLEPWRKDNQVNTTLAYQLALYVVLYSPVQMVTDFPENYQGHPAFQFIKDVGVDWDKTIVLDAQVGDYVVVARKEKGTSSWFLGGITDEHERKLGVRFDFLDADKTYQATIYQDAPNADFRDHSNAYEIKNYAVKKGDEKQFYCAPGGGFAMSIKEVTQ